MRNNQNHGQKRWPTNTKSEIVQQTHTSVRTAKRVKEEERKKLHKASCDGQICLCIIITTPV
ncbi:unnamed protein product [Ceratitis capitata]|uniref:(Mediterranean fruit fly) hypothetical protein n=1 Tax=Ceratitis capitata TaxID=7213 RepID=A0A811U645_CERCA|nr:unnamed protein product [Ceratitis capitata]